MIHGHDYSLQYLVVSKVGLYLQLCTVVIVKETSSARHILETSKLYKSLTKKLGRARVLYAGF